MLLVCPRFRGMEYSLKESFEKIGFEVELVLFEMGFDPHNYFQRIKNFLGMNIDNYLMKEQDKFNDRLIRTFNTKKPDIVYVVQGRWITKETLEKMKEKSYLVLYMWDMISLFPNMKKTFPLYHTIYSFDKNDVKWLSEKKYNAFFRPSGYDDTKYYYIDEEYKYDICFVGAMYKERIVLLKELIKDFPDIKWGIYGEYAPKRKPFKWLRWRLTNEHRYFLNKNIPSDKVNEVYNQSKIVLNIVRSNQKDGWSSKIPEVLGTKSFLITSYFPSVEKRFSGGLLTYKNYEELKQHIEYAINHKEYREKIAEYGYQLVKYELTEDAINRQVLEAYRKYCERIGNKS